MHPCMHVGYVHNLHMDTEKYKQNRRLTTTSIYLTALINIGSKTLCQNPKMKFHSLSK